MTMNNRFVLLQATDHMIGLNLSGTARRFIGVLVLIPIILAVWFDNKIASIVVAILAAGMAFEFSKMLKTQTILELSLIHI